MSDVIDWGQLAILVRRWRGSHGLRRASFKVGCSASTLSRIENGRVCDAETFVRLMKAMSYSLDTFVKNEYKPGAVRPSTADRVRGLLLRDRGLSTQDVDMIASLTERLMCDVKKS